METQKIQRGLEKLGLLTPAMLAVRVKIVFEWYRDRGVSAVTDYEIRQGLDELYPAGRFLPMGTGNLAGALMHMRERKTVSINEAPDKSTALYSLIQKPQGVQPAIS